MLDDRLFQAFGPATTNAWTQDIKNIIATPNTQILVLISF